MMKKIMVTAFIIALCLSGAYGLCTGPAAAVGNGAYHALVIGNNAYQYLPRLSTAVKDARDVAEILKSGYGFDVEVLTDATRSRIVGALNHYRKILKNNDNLLIYYAGHGHYDRKTSKAYWLPVDARSDDDTQWIIADRITSNIKRLLARHILIVADSCYSGTLTRSADIPLGTAQSRAKFIKKMQNKTSRTLLSSGGNEPVMDGGGGGNSVFAKAVIIGLTQEERAVFTAEELFHDHVIERVGGNSDQTPEYKAIRNSRHNGGDFIFVRSSYGGAGDTIPPVPPSPPEPQTPPAPRPAPDSSKRAFTEPVTGMEFVWVEGGCFQMGDTFGDGDGDEKPVHKVCVGGFWMGRYEVTQGQWVKIMGGNPSHFKKGDNYPVEKVSWNDCREFIRRLSSRSGKSFRLPYEAEWEFAARERGKKVRFGTGKDTIGPDEANFDASAKDMKLYSRTGQYRKQTVPVDSFLSNRLGVYNMSGNVWEWCEDWYGKHYYKKSPRDNPHGPPSGFKRVLRGGSWNLAPKYLRAANRNWIRADTRRYFLGFRLLLPPGAASLNRMP